MPELPKVDSPQFRLMAIALIQDGIGMLDWSTEQEFANFESEGRDWRGYVIYMLNGFDLPASMITLAIQKKWHASDKNVETFTRQILEEWKLL